MFGCGSRECQPTTQEVFFLPGRMPFAHGVWQEDGRIVAKGRGPLDAASAGR